jgi:septum formation protein
MRKIVLASSSARRIELFKRLGIDVIVIPPRIIERVFDDPVKTVLENAYRKAYSVLEYAPPNSIVIGIDTVVSLGKGSVLGKPTTISDAEKLLFMLRGRWHTVYSGVYIIDRESLRYSYFVEETRVKMRNFSDDELRLYLTSMEPLGKAGAYAIQGLGLFLIEMIVGDYYNVVGLPLQKLYIVLKRDFGIDLFEEAVKKHVLRKTRSI